MEVEGSGGEGDATMKEGSARATGEVDAFFLSDDRPQDEKSFESTLVPPESFLLRDESPSSFPPCPTSPPGASVFSNSAIPSPVGSAERVRACVLADPSGRAYERRP